MAPKRKAARRVARPTPRPKNRAAQGTVSPPKFVGRDPSPVLDKYPPKDQALAPKGPPSPRSAPPRPTLLPTFPALASSTPEASASASSLPTESSPPAAPKSLISLEKPFDVDEFSQMLGETTIRVEVPREDLAEALRRISEFMGFGIYVYRFRVEPAPESLLKRFVVELERVDYAPEKGGWVRFEEKGRSESPFGPSGGRQ